MNYTEGTQVLDGWTIIRKLGSGSFGTVYQIERKDEYGICERSALKVIRVPQSPEDMKEILDEGMSDRDASTYFNSVMHDIAREVAVMVEMKSCEHIVRYEAHKVIPHENGIGGDILIRMELLTSLPEYRRTHEMDEDTVIRMGKDLADALMYCERKGIIHRDIKPQNIFVNESGTFKLGDFGIARRMQRTTGASRKGTEDYMAPEVYLRRHYGTTVDIYSLGLVLYKYMNYGRLPFLPLPPTPPSFDDREQALQNRMNGVPLPPPAEAGEGLSAIILKACAYDSAQRYRSAGELWADLDALLNGGTIGSTEDDAVKNVDDESEDKGTVGGWPLGEEPKSKVTEEFGDEGKNNQQVKPDDEKEDDKNVESDNVDPLPDENQTEVISIFKDQWVLRAMLKKTFLEALPVWVFALFCLVVMLSFEALYGISSDRNTSVYAASLSNIFLMIIVMAAANLFGIKGASAWRKKLFLLNEEKLSQAKKEKKYPPDALIPPSLNPEYAINERRNSAKKVKQMYIIGSVGIGIALIFIWPEIITNWLKFRFDVSTYVNIGTSTISLASPCIMASGMFSKILLAKGMKKKAAKGLMIGNLINIIFDSICINLLRHVDFYLSDALQRYALILLLSSVISVVFYIVCLCGRHSKKEPDYTQSASEEIESTIIAGVPMATGVLGVGIVGFLSIMREIELSSSSVSIVIGLFGMGIGYGVQSTIRDCFEAGDRKQYRKTMKLILVVGIITAPVLAEVCDLVSNIVGRWRLDGAAIAIWFVLGNVTYILINGLYAMGKKTLAVIICLIKPILFLITINRIFDAHAAEEMSLLADVVICVLAIGLFIWHNKKYWAQQNV